MSKFRIIDGSTKSTKEESIDKVLNLKEPTNVKQVQKFLGLCGHFRVFIRSYSELARPLAQLTLIDVEFKWTQELFGNIF